jgi:Secretion system C-terminal sorting domain
MKKPSIIISTIFYLWTATTNAQITLDTIVPTIGYAVGYNFKTVQISNSETKYFRADTLTNTFNLYNMDWTPFITNISVPVPFNNFDYQCLYVTRTLFDCDSSNIEYLYTSPIGNSDRKIFIMRTDGTQLFELDSAFCEYCYGACLGGSDLVKPIVNTSSGAKLFALRTFPSWTGEVYVYSLCGTLPTNIFDFSQGQQSFVKIFPNPTANTLTFQINPPDNVNVYQLIFLDNNAKEIKRQNINFSTDNFTIDVSSFNSGAYYYTLCTKDKAYQTGKFIITK